MIAAFAVVAAAVIIALVWPITDLIAAHDAGLITGAQRATQLQTAREGVRTQLFTLGAGVFAFGALVYTARNFTLSRNTFTATETRVLNERFIAITTQLGDEPAPVRLAGVHAMAGLADDWEENRQTCVDVLCACLRMPYEPDPGEHAAEAARLAYRANREVRHTVIRVITEHLRPNAPIRWQGLDLDFTGAVVDGGDFSKAEFSAGKVNFSDASFCGARVDFSDASFCGARVDFSDASFSGGRVTFKNAKFSSGEVSFKNAKFSSGEVRFDGARFSDDCKVGFTLAKFSGGRVDFRNATFLQGTGKVDLSYATFSGGKVSFEGASFSGGRVDFSNATFSAGSEVGFAIANFSGSRVDFSYSRFSGGRVDFGTALFWSGEVDFTDASDWSHPPDFGPEGPVRETVKVPVETDAAPS